MNSQGNQGWQAALTKEMPAFHYYEGVRCEYGVGISEDAQAAQEWYKKAYGGDDIQASFAIGKFYEEPEEPGVPVSADFIEIAVSYYQSAVEKGNPAALKRLEELKAEGKLPADFQMPQLPTFVEPSFVSPDDEKDDTFVDKIPEDD